MSVDLAALRAQILALEDFINEPRRTGDETIEVRDYRHEVYRKWGPVCGAVLVAADEIERLRAAKWGVQHADTMNEIVQMGLARDAAMAEVERLAAEYDSLSALAGDYFERAHIAEQRLASATNALSKIVAMDSWPRRSISYAIDRARDTLAKIEGGQ